MALKKLRFEDILLGLTLSLTFLYPLIITLIILYQDAKRKEKEMKIFQKVENIFLSKRCRERILEIVPYLEFVSDSFIEKLIKVCEFTSGKKPKDKEYKNLEEESLYLIELERGTLKVLGKWISDEEFKLLLITYEPKT
ncbi:hypothetical protein [Aquifex aeolicus]|uniref:Uncharacterized protein aq_850 n=1 Tax=Aquifex aeolicus (strain VF5) TaxID=224324 RepID=Y850_AQUAE|nr:hypothetical protein [Aquifex aeolicus]O67017.1 RecName: Full=Uncharacterized protein aq_850 [Aquifex aeolicus VF5]AAC06980.1 putative protein [Aquifex aeolicus VF5]